MHGYGRITWQNGNVYEGEWLRGKIEGQGIYTHSNRDQFELIENCRIDSDGSLYFLLASDTPN